MHWLPHCLGGKQSACSAGDAGDMGSIPGSGKSSGGGNGNPLQYSCQENPMDRGACWIQSVGSRRVEYGWATEHAHIGENKENLLLVLMIYYTLYFDLMFKLMQIHSNNNYFFQGIYEAGLTITVFSMCKVK